MQPVAFTHPLRWVACQWTRLLTGLAMAAMVFAFGVTGVPPGPVPAPSVSPATVTISAESALRPAAEPLDVRRFDEPLPVQRPLLQTGQQRPTGGPAVESVPGQPDDALAGALGQRAPPRS